MKKAIAALAAVFVLTPFGVSAYSESKETQQSQDDWFVQERSQTDGYTARDRARALDSRDVACPTLSQAKRDREFLEQLQLTDGATTPAVIQPPRTAVAAASPSRGQPKREQLADNCHGMMQGT